MADSPVFDKTCEELEQRTDLERIEVRGTVRIALKAAGLSVQSVDAAQMRVALRKVFPNELEIRGVEDAAAVCEGVAAAIEDIVFDGAGDRAGAAAAAMSRFGS